MTSTQLQPGTVIHGTHNDYRIERVLGQGSFGITYVANVRLKGRLGAIESTAMVAIKEFFLRDVSSPLVTQPVGRTVGLTFRKVFLLFVRPSSPTMRRPTAKVLSRKTVLQR